MSEINAKLLKEISIRNNNGRREKLAQEIEGQTRRELNNVLLKCKIAAQAGEFDYYYDYPIDKNNKNFDVGTVLYKLREKGFTAVNQYRYHLISW